MTDRELDKFQLPPTFIIYAGCCSTDFMFEAQCTVIDGIWLSTRLLTADDVDRVHYDEHRATRKARKAWLAKGLAAG